MSEQLTFQPDEDHPGLYQHEGQADTSKLAAFEAEPRSGTQRARVLEAITVSPAGATDEELQHRLQMRENTERPRRVELVRGGWIEDSGRRRKTSSGRWAVVWVRCPQQLEF